MQNQKFRPPRLCRVGVFKTLRRSGTFAAGTLPARRLRAVVAMSHKMSRAARALLALLVVCAPGRVSQGWGPATAHAWAPREVLSTDDLAANAYPSATHVPCVLLLNATGSIGCSTPAGGVTAPLRRFEGLADVRRRLASRTILLLPASAVPEVLADYAKGAGWKTHAAGFMLEPGVDADGNPPSVASTARDSSDSSDGAFPSTSGATLARLLAAIDLGARRALSPQPRRDDDDAGTRVWNPDGFGAARERFENTPIVLLDAAGADVARTFAAANGERGTSRVAEMRFPMAAEAAAADADPAKRCLEQRTCQPIGGHSVLASVPPSPKRANDRETRAYLLVAARLDATAWFHDAAFGANAAMSGLVALMAVAETYADAVRRARASLRRSAAERDANAQVANDAPEPETFDAFLSNDAAPVSFAAFGAEAWGRAGSRRFARLARDAARARDGEAASSDDETDGDVARVDVDALPRWMRRGFTLGGVLELGAVGFAARTSEAKAKANATTVFAHANAAALETERPRRGTARRAFPLVSALETAFARDDAVANPATGASPERSRVALARASAAPGVLPPSSASSFRSTEREDVSAPAVVLAEYDGAYVDGTFGSAYDVGIAAVDTAKIASLVSGTAEALVRLAFGEPTEGAAAAGDDGGKNASETTEAKTRALAASYGALVRANLPDARAVERTTRALSACLIDPEVGFSCALARKLFAPSETFPSRYAGVAPPGGPTPEEAGGRATRACASSDACADGEACVGVAGDGDDEDGARNDGGSATGARAGGACLA